MGCNSICGTSFHIVARGKLKVNRVVLFFQRQLLERDHFEKKIGVEHIPPRRLVEEIMLRLVEKAGSILYVLHQLIGIRSIWMVQVSLSLETSLFSTTSKCLPPLAQNKASCRKPTAK